MKKNNQSSSTSSTSHTLSSTTSMMAKISIDNKPALNQDAYTLNPSEGYMDIKVSIPNENFFMQIEKDCHYYSPLTVPKDFVLQPNSKFMIWKNTYFFKDAQEALHYAANHPSDNPDKKLIIFETKPSEEFNDYFELHLCDRINDTLYPGKVFCSNNYRFEVNLLKQINYSSTIEAEKNDYKKSRGFQQS